MVTKERSCATWRALSCSALLVWMSACSANVLVRRPPEIDYGKLGPYKRCLANNTPCQDDPVFDSSRANAAHTRSFRLPDCPYGIHELVIQDSGSEDAVVLVQCAAPAPSKPNLQPTTAAASTPGAGLPVTSAGGGVTSAPTMSP